MHIKSPIDRAVQALGGEPEFLAALGVKRRTLFYWKRGQRLTLERAVQIERATSGAVTAADLRPDLAKLFAGAA